MDIKTLYKPHDVVGVFNLWRGVYEGIITSVDIHIWGNGKPTILYNIGDGDFNGIYEESDILYAVSGPSAIKIKKEFKFCMEEGANVT